MNITKGYRKVPFFIAAQTVIPKGMFIMAAEHKFYSALPDEARLIRTEVFVE